MKFDTSTTIRNLSAAIVLQYSLMQSGEKFREEIVRGMSHSSATFSAIRKLTSLLCIVHFEGIVNMCKTSMNGYEQYISCSM